MTSLREAATQALEALEAFMQDSPRPYDAIQGQAAINNLKSALAEPVQERNFCPRCGKRTQDIHTCTPP